MRFARGAEVGIHAEVDFHAPVLEPRAAPLRKVRRKPSGWRHDRARHWQEARFGAVRVETRDGQHWLAVAVYVGGLDPDTVCVELYADPLDGGKPLRQMMVRGRVLDDAENGYEYRGRVPGSRDASNYPPRLLPYHPAPGVPLEAAEIRWQR
jgi:starch phosphorylase